MAKGSSSKTLITEAILKMFPGSFLYNGGKELRIQCLENGEVIQIKCAFTCAKDNVESPNGNTVAVDTTSPTKYLEPTAEDMEAVRQLLKELGIDDG